AQQKRAEGLVRLFAVPGASVRGAECIHDAHEARHGASGFGGTGGNGRRHGKKVTSEVMEIVFLGTGTSHGVPMIGCDCIVCRSTDPKDNRLRPSIYVIGDDGTRVLIDTTPDLRQQ